MQNKSESFKIPIFPKSEWDPTALCNPVVAVSCRKSTDVFDSVKLRTIQALLNPLSITAVDAAFKESEKTEEESAPKFFAFHQSWIETQKDVIDKIDVIVEEVRLYNRIPENTVDKWFSLRKQLNTAERIPSVERMIRKLHGVMGDPYSGPFEQSFRVQRVLELGERTVTTMTHMWRELEQALTDVKPVCPSPEDRLGYSFMLKRENRWDNLNEIILKSEKEKITTLVFAKNLKNQTKLFSKMGDFWAEADFSQGRGHWTLTVENLAHDKRFDRTRFDYISKAALLVNIFQDRETKPAKREGKTAKRPTGRNL